MGACSQLVSGGARGSALAGLRSIRHWGVVPYDVLRIVTVQSIQNNTVTAVRGISMDPGLFLSAFN